MAEKMKQKDSTPPPLLLMPSSQGLSFTTQAGSSLLMPVPQMESALMSPEEEGEVDSFVGQSSMSGMDPTTSISNSSSSASLLFQQSSAVNDPFAQLGQSPAPPPNQSVPMFDSLQAARSSPSPALSGYETPPHGPSHMLPPMSVPTSSPPQTSYSTPSSNVAFGGPPIGPPPTSTPQKGGTPGMRRLGGRPQYAPPPPGTYADTQSFEHVPSMSDSPQIPAPQSSMGLPNLPPNPYASPLPPPTNFDMGGPPPQFSQSPYPSQSAPYNNSPLSSFPPKTLDTQTFNVNPPLPPAGAGVYVPVKHHWFFCNHVELRQVWQPFSLVDSSRLEDAFKSGAQDNVIVSTDGGRYDVSVIERTRTSVFWAEPPTHVRRCSWFYRPEGDNRYVPYEEEFTIRLEDEYRTAIGSSLWHKKLEFPDGETIVMHSPQVIVHFRAAAAPDQWGTSQSSEQMRPRVVRRGIEEFEDIEEGEPTQIDHIVFIVHGIGSTCDLRFRSIIECVDDFRTVSLQIMKSHFCHAQESGRAGRVEFLPVRWHQALHGDATGVDRRLKAITLNSIAKLRHFTNDTLLDILFYASPAYAQQIAETVTSEMNRLYNLFLSRNPGFKGGSSVAGHSLGSLVLFDVLAHQADPNAETAPEPQEPLPSTDSTPKQMSRNSTPVSELSQDDLKEDDPSLEQLLGRLGLSDYLETFTKEQVDVETLRMCEDSDIKEMGIPLGPRKKIQTYIKDHLAKDARRKEELQRQAAEEAQRKSAEAAAKLQQEKMNGHHSSHDPLLRQCSTSAINYVSGVAGTGSPFVRYPQLQFSPANFFALGSPVAMFLTVRGVDSLGEDYNLPTCPAFFNIFHPFDPVAYRVEPLVTMQTPPKPVLMPHHKGRKRFHLELKDNLTRMGADIKHKMVDYIKTTWRSINDFALAHRAPPPPEMSDSDMDGVLSEMAEEDEKLETGSVTSSMPDEDFLSAALNQGRRLDYVLQEKPIESFNDYLFALSSHACYWESEDTLLLILKEIYAMLGVAPLRPGNQSTATSPQKPQGPQFPRHPMGAGSSPPFGAGPRPPLSGPGIAMQTSPTAFPVTMPTHPSSTPNFGPPPMGGFVRK